jgi:chorismate synthase
MEILGGPLFAVAGAGESHGPAITTIVFGCPPGLKVSRTAVQAYLDRRRPGSNKHGTPRHEDDSVVLLSGLYHSADHEQLTSGPAVRVALGEAETSTTTYEEGYTTGEPIAAMVLSAAKKSQHYEQFAGPAGEVRPGHTDLVKYHQTGGFVDIRGGGRSSYRSTISDVIGGSIARLFLQQHFGTVFLSSVVQVGTLTAEQSLMEWAEHVTWQHQAGAVPPEAIAELVQALQGAEIYTLDAEFARQAGALIRETRIQGDSLGAQVEVVALNVPPLVGAPLYNSLKLRLMGALGGLQAVQACEVGAGTHVASRLGSENNDPIRHTGYQTNHHGGLIGGITTGMPLAFRVSFKPTSSIVRPQQSVRKNLEEIDFSLQKGRHDPCVGVRAGVALESRMAIEVMNAVLMHQAQGIDPARFRLFQ